MVKQAGVALIAGFMFGIGLGVSQMIDRDRVIGFLDITGNWDPTLLFVLGGAVGVTTITFRFVLQFPHPLLSPTLYLPTKRDIDGALLLGATIFGIGWGVAGYCPGPGIGALVLGTWNPVLFLAAFVTGSLACKGVLSWLEPRKPSPKQAFSRSDTP